MSFFTIILIIAIYFGVLLLISYLTSKGSDSETFFTGNKNSPWYIVAYGMIGAALSGVTFVSMPGYVYGSGFQFGQFILGNIVGYMIITFVLIPLYYRYNLVSIYSYLEKRFGFYSYKTGAFVFIISQSFGAALRMLLAVIVLREIFGNEINQYFSADSVAPIWILALVFMVLIFNEGYINYYYGEETIIHYKGESTVKNEVYYQRFFNAMEIFVSKYYKQKNSCTWFILYLGLKIRYYLALFLYYVKK